MNEGLREAMLGRMKILRTAIEALSATADELMRSANLLEGQLVAQALRDGVQRRRVKILEMQGRLAALHERYAARLSPDREMSWAGAPIWPEPPAYLGKKLAPWLPSLGYLLDENCQKNSEGASGKHER